MWGQRWSRGDVEAKHYDASLLMWDIHRNVLTDRLPDGRTVVHFHLAGSSDRKSHFWLMLEPGTADLCITDPGHEVDVTVQGHVRTMVDYWLGYTDFAHAVRQGELTIVGPPRLVRALPTWFRRSLFATVELPATAAAAFEQTVSRPWPRWRPGRPRPTTGAPSRRPAAGSGR